MKKTIFLLTVLVGALMVYAGSSFADSDPFTSRALNRGMGIRPLSLGGAYVAIAEDEHAAHWNPAGLANENFFNIHWDTMNLRGDKTPLSSDNISFSIWHIGMSFWDQSIVESVGSKPNIEAWTLGFGTRVIDGFNFGINYKQVDRDKKMGWGVDVGTLLDIIPELSLGLVGGNLIGPDFGSIVVAPVGKVGLAYRPFEEILLVSLQGDWSGDTPPLYHAGVEGNIKGVEALSQVSLRGGYERSAENISNISGGIGMNLFGFLSVEYGASYPLVGDEDTKGVLQNHLGLSLRFGGSDRDYIFRQKRPRPSGEEIEEVERDDSGKKEWVF